MIKVNVVRAACCNAALYVGSLRLQIRSRQQGLPCWKRGEEGGEINVNRLGVPAAPNETITMATGPD